MKKILLFLCAILATQMANAWYLIGSTSQLKSWDVGQALQYNKVDGNIQIWENIELSNGTEFKFVQDRSWTTNYGYGNNMNTLDKEYTLYSGGGNCKWTGTAGTYSIWVNTSTKKVKVFVPVVEGPSLSNFKATSTEVNPGEEVTFSCDIANGTAANIYYTVDGERLAGNTWTATEKVGAHIATANYEGATSKQLTVVVMGEPMVEEGQNVVFFDNTQSNWATVYAYAWEGASGIIAAWPGTQCVHIGNNIWQYECGDKLPGKIIFNNNSGTQTSDLAYTNHGLYNSNGLVKTILPAGADVIELAVPAVAYTGFEEVLNVSYNESLYEGYTLSFTINDVEQSEATWTPTAEGTYTIVAVLTKGGTVKTSEPAVVTVKSPVALYLLKEEGKELNYIYYWTPGGCPAFPGVKMNETFIYGEYYYYYAIKNDNADFNFSNGTNATQTVDISATNGAHYYRLGAMDGGKYKVEVLPTPEPYAETIVAGCYYLEPTVWAVDNAWYAVYFYNRNKAENNYQWVQGYVTKSGLVVFTYGGEEKYTHMIFCRMNPAFLDEEFVGEMQWNTGDEAGASDQHVWNQTEGIEYGEKPAFSVCIINGWNEDSYEWSVLENATGIEGVEATNGIAYANGIVAAEGAIEVYNVNGMVVARGNESLDLRNLNAGVYIVRNGNNVRKVVR